MTSTPRTDPVRLPPSISVNLDGCEVDDLSFCGGVLATVAADESWDVFVRTAVENDWVGVEALSGIPGSVADAVIGNVMAYGQQASDTVAWVRTWDRIAQTQRTFATADCGFAERRSRLGPGPGADAGRYAIVDVAFLMRQGDLTRPVRDPGLAELLDVPLAARTTLTHVRAAILAR